MSGLTIQEQLKNEGHVVRTTKGISMQPMLYEGKTVVDIKAISGDECKKYDIALFIRTNGDFVLHRIIKCRRDYFIIRGDNLYEGEIVPKSAIIGIVTTFFRNGKWIDTSNKFYRAYTVIWCITYPLRIIIRVCYNIPKKILRKILK